jgi:hypothetical protein
LHSTQQRRALISAARLQWALDSKLTLRNLTRRQIFFADNVATKSLEPIAVINKARAHGLRWQQSFIQSIVRNKKLQLLTWLVQSGCPWDLRTAAIYAIDSVPLLQGILSLQPESWRSAQLEADLMWEAGVHNLAATLSWLHERGTAWPASFVRVHTATVSLSHYARELECWSVDAVQLALSSGASWDRWLCYELDGEYYECST